MIYLSAIVVAAGRGERFNNKILKPLAKIDTCPTIFYCLKTISEHPLVKDIILVVNAKIKDRVAGIIKQYRIRKISHLVIGGRRRQDSVYNGLKTINERTDLVLIHDGARPFIDKEAVTAAVKEAQDTGAAIVGVPVKATIKEVQSSPAKTGSRQKREKFSRKNGIPPKAGKVQSRFIIKKTLNRDELWEIQTPQVFRKDLILRAYKKFGNREVTDDAALVERLGVKVKVVRGSYFNIKITTPEDLVLAEAILKTQKYNF